MAKPKPKKDDEDLARLGDAPHLDRLFLAKSRKDGEFAKFDYHSHWSSTEKFAKHIRSIEKKSAWHDGGWDNDESFSGTKTMDEALEMADGGWMEGVAKVSSLQQKILANSPLLKEPIKYGIAGSVPNVPRAIAGDPQNMKVVDLKKSRRRPVITLVCNMGASWIVDANIMSNRAAALAAIIDKIEAGGFAVEVISIATSRSYEGFSACTSIVLKESHQPVDIARLAYGLGHVSFFRRLVFADWGGSSDCKPLGRGLGTIQQIKKEPDDMGHDILVVPEANEGTKYFKNDEVTLNDGVPYLIELLRKQGCEAFRDIAPDPRFDKKQNILDDLDDDDDF